MTADNDLTRPLGLAAERRKGPRKLVIAAIVLAVLGIAAVAGAGGYLWHEHGPLIALPGGTTPGGTTPGNSTASSASGEVVTVTPVDRTLETPADGVDDVYTGLVEVRPEGTLTDVAGGKVVIHDPSARGTMELASLPDPGLLEPGPYGPLPTISPTGLRPLDAYARPLSSRGRADRVAIVIGGIGINRQTTASAVRDLPGEISLALAPYGRELDATVSLARGSGHELLLQVPMEPFNYPANNPGDQTLLASAGTSANLDNLHWLMARATTYVGVINYLGARFTNDQEAMRPVVEEIGQRGLLYLDDGSSPRSAAGEIARGVTPYVQADVVLDGELTAEAIDLRLDQLQKIARERGYAVATGTAFPITIERVAAFARSAERRGIELVPVSALARAARG